MSSSSLDEVSTTTGISLVAGSARMRSRTSSPLSLGSLRSSSMTAGFLPVSLPWYLPLPKRKSRASRPSRVTTISLAMRDCLSARSVSSSSSGLSSTRRIIFSAIAASFQGEEKHRSLSRLRVGPDPAAVPAHDALHRGEADTGSRILARGVQPLERTEQLVGVRHVESRAVVAHVEHLAPVVRERSDLDARMVGLRAELPSVADQIFQCRAHQPG